MNVCSSKKSLCWLRSDPFHIQIVFHKMNGFPSDINISLDDWSVIAVMFHVTWTTFKSNRDQLGTVSAYAMSSVPWSNQHAHLLETFS